MWAACRYSYGRVLGVILAIVVGGVDPLKRLGVRLLSLQLVLYDLTHLRVQERVSYYHLFFLEVFLEALAALEGQVIEVE